MPSRESPASASRRAAVTPAVRSSSAGRVVGRRAQSAGGERTATALAERRNQWDAARPGASRVPPSRVAESPGIVRNVARRGMDSKATHVPKVAGVPLVLQLCNFMGLLVQEPLQQLHASLQSDLDRNTDVLWVESLNPLTEFLGCTLAALQGLQDLVHGEAVVSSGALSRLLEGREDLMFCAKSAGQALRSLATEAGTHGLGARVKVLQESLSETLDGVRTQWRLEDARRHEQSDEVEAHRLAEISELRAELRDSRKHAECVVEEGAAERRDLCREMESFARSCVKENGAVDEQRWESIFTKVGYLAKHTDSVSELSELWAAQAAERDWELRALRERADAAVIELRCSEQGAEAARACSVAEQRLVEITREDALQALSEERIRLESMVGAARGSEEAQERAASRLAGEVEQERRERASLSMQLHGAMETIANREHAIESLQRSLSEEIERARRPPIAAAPPSTTASLDARLAPFVSDSAHRHLPPPFSGSQSVPPFPGMDAPRDGQCSSSVCRVSTESTAFMSGTAAAPSLGQSTASTWAQPARDFRWNGERPPAMPPVDASFNTSSLRSVSVDLGRGDTASDAMTGGYMANHGTQDHQLRPWELPPQDFLNLWRRSRSSALPSGITSSGPGTPARSVSQSQEIAVPSSAERIRITASFQ